MRTTMAASSGMMLIIATVLAAGVAVEGIGMNWGTISSHPLPPKTVVQLLKDNGIKKVKMFYVEDDCLMALANSGIEVMVGFGNGLIKDFTDYTLAKNWVTSNVTHYRSKGVNITLVGVGNEPFLRFYGSDYLNVTLPTLKNVQKALDEAGIGKEVKATIPFNADVYESPGYNPVPSAGGWRGNLSSLMTDIVHFLNSTGAPFFTNIYPFLSVSLGGPTFPVDYAFFDGSSHGITDGKIYYGNVFDANYDTLVSALKAAGVGDLEIAVGEIGWPTDGDIHANVTLAEKFYSGFIPKIASKKGTPLRPNADIAVYLFGLLDEDEKSVLPGQFERHWGIFTSTGQVKYPIDFSGSGKNHTAVPAKDVNFLPKKWCIMDPKTTANKSNIQANLNYACDRCDCTPLSDDSSCSGVDPDVKNSFVFNAYFQSQNQVNGSCNFDGLAMITDKDPSVGTCQFAIGIEPYAPPPVGSPAAAPSSDDAADGPAGSGGGSHHKSAAPALMKPFSLIVATLVAVLLF